MNKKAMSDKEKAHQIAWETSKHYDPLLSKEAWCEMAAIDMAGWKNEQKPAWSKEDESMLDYIIHNIHFAETHRKVTGSFAMEKEQVNWLKSIKERLKGE